MRILGVASLVALLSITGCGEPAGETTGTTTTGGTATGTGTSCAAMAETCAASQQGCAVEGGSARCVPCDPGTYAVAGACSAIPGAPLSHDFPELTVKPGEEQIGSCRSWTLGNDEEIWVNAVELVQTEDSHHSNWVFVPDDELDGPDGVWPCGERGYDFYVAISLGGLVYAQSTQAAHEVQKFAPGAAVRIPPHARIISDIHLLNTSQAPVTGHAALTLYTLDAPAVTTKLSAWHIEYDALGIPPHATSRFTGHCAVAADVSAKTGKPFAPKVHYVLPHTHTLASGFFAKVMGGPNDGVSMLDLGTFNGEAHGKLFDPPVDLAGADGIEFTCQYANPRETYVGWGFGSQEMCELFGFAEDSPFFQARVSTGKPDGTSADGAQLFSGSCVTEQVSGIE